eukprot:TRINITY_DN2920_c0_g1_i1.p1 TRINITY_DN2920_c0_g1~~TRINITY_DN2920_c0_g1_i1.p1  ORF type:complete len:480 (+),score=61.05 TRINITY_DN2920_c0_g1_i1:47-1486(+)
MAVCGPLMRRCNSCPAWIGHRTLEMFATAHVSEFQADPMYFLYYHNQRPVDRRLPVPIIKSHFPGFTPLFTENAPLSFEVPICAKGEADWRLLRVSTEPNTPASGSANRLPKAGRFSHDPYHVFEELPSSSGLEGRRSTCPERVMAVAVKARRASAGELQPPAERESHVASLRYINRTFGSGLCGGALLAYHISQAIKLEHVLGERLRVEEEVARKGSVAQSTFSYGTDECLSEWDTQSCSTAREWFLPPTAPRFFRVRPVAPPLVPHGLEDRIAFLTRPVPEACGTVQCVLAREPSAAATGSRYTLSLEIPPTPSKVVDAAGRAFIDSNPSKATSVFLCAVTKAPRRSSFNVFADRDDADPRGPSFVGKCRRNPLGTAYTVAARSAGEVGGAELANVVRSPAAEGKPAQVSVVLFGRSDEEPAECAVLRSTAPLWNAAQGTYEVDFGPRVKVPSSRNLQLEGGEGRPADRAPDLREDG